MFTPLCVLWPRAQLGNTPKAIAEGNGQTPAVIALLSQYEQLDTQARAPTGAKFDPTTGVQNWEVAQPGMPPQAQAHFLPVSEYAEVWNDRGSGADEDVSVWKARVPDGCHSLGMTAQLGHGKPTSPTLVIRAGGRDVAPPDRYELAWWQERGHRRFWCWHPIPPSGYASLGDVGTLSANPPSREEVVCVAIACLAGTQPLGAQIWNDRNGGAPKDGAFFAQPGGSGLFRCSDDSTHNRPAGAFYCPQGGTQMPSRFDGGPPAPQEGGCCVLM